MCGSVSEPARRSTIDLFLLREPHVWISSSRMGAIHRRSPHRNLRRRRRHDVVVLDNFELYYDLGIKEYNLKISQSAAIASDRNYELVRGSTTDAALVDDLFHRSMSCTTRQHKSASGRVSTSYERSPTTT